MYGIGILAKITNVLPFAYFIVAPFSYGRGNAGNNRQGALYKNYYRQYWFRMLFGKHIKITIPVMLTGYILLSYNKSVKDEEDYYHFMVLGKGAGVEYDSEENLAAKQAYYDYQERNLYKKNFLQLSTERARYNHKMKASVFDDYISKQSI
jgi:hypothetical protein